MMRQFLFPTDFSPCAERAFTHAAHLAAVYGARLHILSVTDDSDEEKVNPMTYLPLGRDELAAELGLPRGAERKQEMGANGSHDSVNVTIPGVSPWRTITRRRSSDISAKRFRSGTLARLSVPIATRTPDA